MRSLLVAITLSTPMVGSPTAGQEAEDFAVVARAFAELLHSQVAYPLAFDPRIARALDGESTAPDDHLGLSGPVTMRDSVIRALGFEVGDAELALRCGSWIEDPIGSSRRCSGQPGVVVFGRRTVGSDGTASYAFRFQYSDRYAAGRVAVVRPRFGSPYAAWSIGFGSFLKPPGEAEPRLPAPG